MKTLAATLLAGALLAGCQSAPQTSTDAVVAGGPHQIEVLTDETTVYSCPKCGMDYDGPGQCTMCNVDLVEIRIAYMCPADNEPVAHAGKCPRCNMNARIVRTALAVNAEAPAEDAETGAAGGQ